VCSSASVEDAWGDDKYVQNLDWKKLKGNLPLGRRRHRCEDIIKIDLKEIGWEDVD
jgi:hypothetical protein